MKSTKSSNKLRENDEPFFNFTMLTPLMAFDKKDLPSIFNNIYDYGAIPVNIITDRQNPFIVEQEKVKPKGFPPIYCIIVAVIYDKTFLA